MNNLEEFYEAVIGAKNQNYYLRYFRRFDDNGKIGFSWHWPAFFITFYWLLYRKMWLNALIYFLLPPVALILIAVVSAITGTYSEVRLSYWQVLIALCLFILPPLYANAIYYKHCRKKIVQASTSSQNLQRKLGELSAKGGTSHAALIIVIFFVFVAIGTLTAIAIPAYQDYTIRVRMAEATSIGNVASELVSNYYYQHQTFPVSLKEAGFEETLPASVREIGFDRKNGVVRLTMANAPIDGKVLLLVPSTIENNKISWKCMSQNIQNKHMPSQCREKK